MRGGPVLGICNGFQVLLEAGMLPGAMVRNDGIKFVSRHVSVRVEQTDTPFTVRLRVEAGAELPIAHGEGNYYAAPDVLDRDRSESPGRLPLHRRRRATVARAQPERLAQQHRRHLQSASAMSSD